jgi:2-C-methyl-D-erythritol 4-phosphate cytidylyltransferase/2-C-methyl-D-erythritol 2,4-cyclodiphosphate synthase
MVVIHHDDRTIYDRLVVTRDTLLPPIIGGQSRRQSVHCGLLAARKLGFKGKILVHDAARPFVDHKTIASVLDKVSQGICAIPAHPVCDTLKQCDDNNEVLRTVSRSGVYCAQTPQGFMAEDIMAIHDDAESVKTTEFTDDASMFEAAGLRVKIVESPSSNFKITTPDDLARARLIVAHSTKEVTMLHADIRTGNGYDVHALVPGDGVILCGYKIPFDKKLDGHSDADAALHALTDALLGTIGAGDIGTHFPPCDPQWKDASSDRFLKAALSLVGDKGGNINNIDVTIICEAPKIGPHREQMRENLASLCALDPERVSLKATTNEKLGFLGRQEGIAAIATTTISFGTRK